MDFMLHLACKACYYGCEHSGVQRRRTVGLSVQSRTLLHCHRCCGFPLGSRLCVRFGARAAASCSASVHVNVAAAPTISHVAFPILLGLLPGLVYCVWGSERTCFVGTASVQSGRCCTNGWKGLACAVAGHRPADSFRAVRLTVAITAFLISFTRSSYIYVYISYWRHAAAALKPESGYGMCTAWPLTPSPHQQPPAGAWLV